MHISTAKSRTARAAWFATLDYYKGTQEYTAVIELPHNITEVIGNGIFTVNFSILQDTRKTSELHLLKTEPEINAITTPFDWVTANATCEGHLARVAPAVNLNRVRAWAMGTNNG